ncbi:MAG: hypothetical protein ACREGJ_02035 [Candidatus Saccharimonadales bacterium]
MIKLKFTQKTIIIALASVLAAILILIGSWLWLQQNAATAYQQQLQAQVQQTKTALTERAGEFKQLHASPNIAKAREELAKLEGMISSVISKPAPEEGVLGLSLVPQPARNARAERMMHLIALNGELKKAQGFLSYQEEILAILHEVSGKEGANTEQLKALHAAWQGAVDKLKAITPADPAKEFHVELLASVETITVTLSTLPDLYEKRDRTGFSTKQKELESKIAGLHELSTVLHDLAIAHDKAIAGALKAVQ